MRQLTLTAAQVTKRRPLASAEIASVAIALLLGFADVPLLHAQADPNLRFEVASVRRVEIADINGRVPIFLPVGGVGTSDPHRISYRAQQILPLIAVTFGFRGDQITAPQSVIGERYDIVANIPDGATKEQESAARPLPFAFSYRVEDAPRLCAACGEERAKIQGHRAP
jgi:hypothetical protein